MCIEAIRNLHIYGLHIIQFWYFMYIFCVMKVTLKFKKNSNEREECRHIHTLPSFHHTHNPRHTCAHTKHPKILNVNTWLNIEVDSIKYVDYSVPKCNIASCNVSKCFSCCHSISFMKCKLCVKPAIQIVLCCFKLYFHLFSTDVKKR